MQHQTSGVEIFASPFPERQIFLDSQPILSSSVLARLIQENRNLTSFHDQVSKWEKSTKMKENYNYLKKKKKTCFISYEMLNEANSLQLTLLALCVSNLVCVVFNGSIDDSVLHLLQISEIIRFSFVVWFLIFNFLWILGKEILRCGMFQLEPNHWMKINCFKFHSIDLI